MRLLHLAAAAAVTLASFTASAHEGGLRILFLSKSSGFEHSTIKQVDGQPSHTDKTLQELAGRMGATLTATKDASQINAANLQNFDVVIFYTTEDLMQPGADGNPAMGPDGVEELRAWVQAGGGFMGFHCASDTFHRGNTEAGAPRNKYGADSPYLDLLGGEFAGHGAQFTGTVRLVYPKHPTALNIPADWRIKDEWYYFKDLVGDNIRVIALLDPLQERGKQDKYNVSSYPVIWCSDEGEGRVYYNAMGHREEVWSDETFQQVVTDAITWVSGHGEADAEPNLQLVAPDVAKGPTVKAAK
jgi:type 1 glutamine amidotransferase